MEIIPPMFLKLPNQTQRHHATYIGLHNNLLNDAGVGIPIFLVSSIDKCKAVHFPFKPSIPHTINTLNIVNCFPTVPKQSKAWTLVEREKKRVCNIPNKRTLKETKLNDCWINYPIIQKIPTIRQPRRQ